MKTKHFLLLTAMLASMGVGQKASASTELCVKSEITCATVANNVSLTYNSSTNALQVSRSYTLYTEQWPNSNYDRTHFRLNYDSLSSQLGTTVSAANVGSLLYYPLADGTYGPNYDNWFDLNGKRSSWGDGNRRFFIQHQPSDEAGTFILWVGQCAVEGTTSAVGDSYATTFYMVAGTKAIEFNLTLKIVDFDNGDSGDETYTDYPIQNVDFSHVHLSDRFWQPRMEQNQTVTIPIALQQCYSTNRVLNFQKAAAILRGENIGYFDTEFTFDDTDIYKILEGMAYSVQTQPNAELDKQMDELIAIIAAAQEPDGYLYTARTAGKPGALHAWVGANRWEADPNLSHELYNCGHLYEAAVAHYISTGKTSLLDVAIKNADLLVKDFLEGGLTYEPGHQIVEMGLVKMYRVTGKTEYLKLAKYFLDLRGTKGVTHQEYSQTHKPVIAQDEAVGHAVRAAYMYAGMADVAAIMNNESYLNAIDNLWQNVAEKKLYVTGGIGARSSGESFGANYELPNASAYCETCAAIANIYWNHRMFLLHGESKYYDIIERTLYNAVIAGISLSGDHFFYPNPLASDGTYERSEWFGCACCPSNLCRFTASVPGYVYAHKADSLYVNLYMQGTADVTLASGEVKISQTADMPWNGDVSITIDHATGQAFTLMMRLPAWATDAPLATDLYTYLNSEQKTVTVNVNGTPTDYTLTDGYMTISRTWADGDVVTFSLPMDIHRTLANEQVAADNGLVAIERGPIVYCLEWPENDNLTEIVLPDDAAIDTAWTDNLNGVVTLKANGRMAHQEADAAITAIPYYAWANRGKGLMEVWIPRSMPQSYSFRASDWTTGDSWRIAADKITYDEADNCIVAKSAGSNNIALMLKYNELSYDVSIARKYLVVRGTGLSTSAGMSYLWWLNGINRGTQVAPTVQRTIEVGGETQTIIAWDMSASGIYDNFVGDYPNVCLGQTIFGLTSSNSDGSCCIYDIDFVADVDAYATATGIGRLEAQSASAAQPRIVNLQGQKLSCLQQGFNIVRQPDGHAVKMCVK
jgi:hypothetical protein